MDKFIKIYASQEVVFYQDNDHGIEEECKEVEKGWEIIRVEDIRKIYLDMATRNEIRYDYYNHKAQRIYTLVERYSNETHCNIRLARLEAILKTYLVVND